MKILVATAGRFAAFKLPVAQIDWLRGQFPAHQFCHATTTSEVLSAIGDAEVALATHLPPGAAEIAGSLRWIHSWAAGVNALMTSAIVERPIVVTSSRGLNAETVAEHALALLLALFRGIPDAARAQAERRWAQEALADPGPRLLSRSRVLVVGAGAIGSAIAQRLAALGATVVAVRRRPALGAPPGSAQVAGPEALASSLPEADAVVLAAPGTPATRRLFDVATLARLPARAVIVNVSRGGMVDEPALLAALDAGRLAGAALDVFETEPLPADSRLWTHPRVLVTPHVAGFLPGYWQAAAARFAANLRRFEGGMPLLDVVDKRAGY